MYLIKRDKGAINRMQNMEVNRSMFGTIILGIVSILLLSMGQTFLKFGLNQMGGVCLSDGTAGFLKLFHSPFIILSFFFYGISAILWLDVLSKMEFSLAYPMVGATYVFALVIGRFFFHETIGWERLLGVGLIVMGIFFMVKSGASG
jgi:drug/metabolite transporter (DMT)-like permease